MAQPTEYDRQFSFTNHSVLNPSDPQPGDSLDAEFNAVKISLDETQGNLALIQDDDGALARGSVGRAQLSSGISLGFEAPEQWQPDEAYDAGASTVFYQQRFYACTVTHVSGADFDIENWEEVADFSLAAMLDDGSVDAAKLAINSVTTSKIENGAITEAKIESDAVTTTKILDANVTSAKLADGGITTAKIANASVTTAKIADANVTDVKLAAGSVTTAKILDANVTSGKIASLAVSTAKIADDAVTLGKMEHGTQGDLFYCGASGAPARLGAGTSGQVLKSNGPAANPAWITAPGTNYQAFTSSGTWTKPSGFSADSLVFVMAWGAGGAGGLNGGAGGGSGGAYIQGQYKLSQLSATESVSVGAPGVSEGANGGNSTFKGITAYGGGSAQTGTSGGRGAGGTFGGPVSSSGGGPFGGDSSGELGSTFGGGASNANDGGDSIYGGGGAGNAGDGGNSIYGGGGGTRSGSAGTSVFGGGGGTNNVAGSAPGGGGGRGAAGARGEVRVWVLP